MPSIGLASYNWVNRSFRMKASARHGSMCPPCISKGTTHLMISVSAAGVHACLTPAAYGSALGRSSQAHTASRAEEAVLTLQRSHQRCMRSQLVHFCKASKIERNRKLPFVSFYVIALITLRHCSQQSVKLRLVCNQQGPEDAHTSCQKLA